VTTIRISDRAGTPAEVILELRKTADFIEALDRIGATRVMVSGDLNVEVFYGQPDRALITMARNPAATVPTQNGAFAEVNKP
jgi:hypothetical protein